MWLVVTEIRSESFGLITEQRQYITTHVIFYRRVWYDRALSMRYMCIRSLGIILIPLGYLCAKFRFFRGLRCWAKKSRHSLTHSLSHSINHSPNLLMRREPKLWLRNTCCHSASNVSFIFDQYLFFTNQIDALSKSCYSHIHQLRCICLYLDRKTLKRFQHIQDMHVVLSKPIDYHMPPHS